MLKNYETSVNEKYLDKIANSIFKIENPKRFLKKVVKLMDDRYKMYFQDNKIDWAIAEILAYGSILNESYNVRISGQDVERGTFSHRHAILKDIKSEEDFVPLNYVNKFQGNFEIYNSLLSEYAVMGFEYGCT